LSNTKSQAELKDDAEMYRAELIERVVEHDDALMEAYLGGELSQL
jgi:translation elongation factor EF-G